MIRSLTLRSHTVAFRLASAFRLACARLTGVQIGPGCCLAPMSELALGPAPARRGLISLGAGCQLARGVILHPYAGSISLGDRVHLGPYTVIYGHGGVTLGAGTLVAMHCRILSSNHSLPPPGRGIRAEADILLPTIIGPDVWLGAGVTILGGVTLGEGVVVGAGAVVTKDVPAHTVVAGVPARPIGHR